MGLFCVFEGKIYKQANTGVQKVKRCIFTHTQVTNMRRSLTVTPENDKKILLTKGRFLTGDEPYDIDYTTMVNILIELGHKLMFQAWNDSENPKIIVDKNEIVESFKKHYFNAELKEEAVGDQVAEIIFRKLVEQAGLGDKTRQNPSPTLPDGEKQNKSAKTQKYVT
jgi:hypothetical protein